METFAGQLVERLGDAVDSSCRSSTEQQSVINIARILARLIPFIFEDPDWANFFWSDPGGREQGPALAHSLLLRLADLLFCPDFTVASSRTRSRDEVSPASALTLITSDLRRMSWSTSTAANTSGRRGWAALRACLSTRSIITTDWSSSGNARLSS